MGWGGLEWGSEFIFCGKGDLVIVGQMIVVASILEDFPWKSMAVTLLSVGMVVLLVYLLRPTGNEVGKKSFVIRVDEEDVTFSGNFPAGMEQTVAEFLREDVGVPGSYEVRGHWDVEESGAKRLIVTTKGENVKGMEQRIRNFLKMSLKGP